MADSPCAAFCQHILYFSGLFTSACSYLWICQYVEWYQWLFSKHWGGREAFILSYVGVCVRLCVCLCELVLIWKYFFFFRGTHPSVYITVYLALSNSPQNPFICQTYECQSPPSLFVPVVCVYTLYECLWFMSHITLHSHHDCLSLHFWVQSSFLVWPSSALPRTELQQELILYGHKCIN